MNKPMKDFQIQAVGLMSGTSLDGLDVCCVTFRREEGRWTYHIDAARGYTYPDDLRQALGSGAQQMSALDFVTLHSAYGKFLGERVNDFLHEYDLHPDLIASHGHTVFHEPQKRIMFQIGDGAAIAAETGIPTVSDFRRLDIMLGGQGAPLVPVGDRLLFADYDFCLNIGGFSNISFERDGQRVAFDVSPANYVINHYCRRRGLEFDRDGLLARSGTICPTLLEQLNGLDFYRQEGPKSLGREWVEQQVYPMLDASDLGLEDLLRTFYEHVAHQVARVVEAIPAEERERRMLVTGGGAYNLFLTERMAALCPCRLVVPDGLTVEYKEALIFAFLGALYMADEPGCLASVTGARRDNIGGMLFKV